MEVNILSNSLFMSSVWFTFLQNVWTEVTILTPQNPVLPEKLVVTHLVNIFSAFYETKGPFYCWQVSNAGTQAKSVKLYTSHLFISISVLSSHLHLLYSSQVAFPFPFFQLKFCMPHIKHPALALTLSSRDRISSKVAREDK